MTFMRCDNLFSYTPSTWLEYLTQPTAIFLSSPNFISYLEQLTKRGSITDLIKSPLNTVKNLYNLPTLTSFANEDRIKYNYILSDLIRRSEQGYYAMSLLNHASMFAMIAAIYRVLDLTSISIQHSINRSKLSQTSKLMCSSIVSVMPYLAMEFMGYPAKELFIASSFRLAASYLASAPSSQNFIREIDLISSFKNFYMINFLYQNLAYGIRNLASTFLREWWFDPHSLGIVNLDPFYSKTARFEICLNEMANLSIHSVKVYSTLRYFTDEIGWMLGKMAVDSLIILLKRMSIIEDLRDPFAPVISYFTARQKAKHIPLKHQKQDDAPKHFQQKRRVVEVGTEEDKEYLQSPPIDKPLKTKKAKKLPAQAKEKSAANIEVAEQDALDYREPIAISGTNMTLVPLSSEHTNLWGVICTKEDPSIFYESLSPGTAVSGDNRLKFIAKISSKQNYYELKPPGRSDYRAIGKNYFDGESEDALYYVLKKCRTYEDAMPIATSLLQQMNSTEKRLELIVFDRIENHKEAKKSIYEPLGL